MIARTCDPVIRLLYLLWTISRPGWRWEDRYNMRMCLFDIKSESVSKPLMTSKTKLRFFYTFYYINICGAGGHNVPLIIIMMMMLMILVQLSRQCISIISFFGSPKIKWKHQCECTNLILSKYFKFITVVYYIIKTK